MSFVASQIAGFDVPYRDYANSDVLRGNREFVMSRGELFKFVECPAKWIAGSGEDEESDALTWGTAIDVLGPHPERFSELYAVAPATYKNEKGEEKPWNWNAKVCQAWRDGQGEKTVIKNDLQSRLIAALKVLRESDVQPLIECSKTQVHVVGQWRDMATGLTIPVQCLIDLVPDKENSQWGRRLCNFKTARCGDPDTFPRVIEDYGYDVGAALDTDLYIAATGEDRTDYVFAVQENIPPYHVTSPLMALTTEFIEYGRVKYRIALREYAQCLATNKWPSYPTGDRLVYGDLQFLDPKALFKYRESGGVPAERTPIETTRENFDVIP